MRYMLITRATKHSEAGVRPSRESEEQVRAYYAELAGAGVLCSAERLYPSASGLRMSYVVPGGRPACAAGPLAEVNELMAGYAVIDVASEAEAVAWAKRMPDPDGYGNGVVELRRLVDEPEAAPYAGTASLEIELRSQLGMLKPIETAIER